MESMSIVSKLLDFVERDLVQSSGLQFTQANARKNESFTGVNAVRVS